MIVDMKNPQGKKCDISPYNKFCPCYFDIRDVKTGAGEEVVILRKLALASYNAYMRTSPGYDTNYNAIRNKIRPSVWPAV